MLSTLKKCHKLVTMSTTRRVTRESTKRGLADSPQVSKYFEKSTIDEPIEKKRGRKAVTDSVTTESKTEVIVEKPKNWETILENIRKMRSQRDAVVDTKGAEKTFDQNEGNAKNKRFQVLVSLMLSSQTRDETTYKTMQELREYGLTVDNIISTKEDKLKQLIHSVSFFNNKAKHIKRTAIILRDQYAGDIPDSLEGLLSLPGVGPKMAHLAMLIGWGQCTGIAVDTHVHRICNRLEWAHSKTPEATQKQIERWIPKELWNEMNLLLVGFGQTICTPRRPKCNQCLNRAVCPSASQLDF